jgi:glycosyltransferase involved in cell wall biosynthesis
MRELSVLQIAHDHPDWTPGGTAILARDLARALDARPGSRAAFLACATDLTRPGDAPGALGVEGVDHTLRTGAYDRFMMRRLDGTAWVESLGRLIGATRPDVIHLHGLDRLGAEILPALRRLAPRAGIVVTLHDYQVICANDGLMTTTPDHRLCGGATPASCARCLPNLPAARHALRRAHLLALLETADAIIAPSAFLRARLIVWGLPADRITLVANAVPDAPRAASTVRKLPNRFAFLGTIARHKGVLTLLDAATRLRAADLRVTLRGGLNWPEPAFRDAFDAALAAAHPVAQHLGRYDRAEVPRAMAAADWIVVPSLWWENAPLVILEARRAGRPVIASDIGGMREMVRHGVDGLLVPTGDAAALAETMAAAAADPALWSRLAGGGVHRDFETFLEDHMRLYSNLRAKAAA